MNRRRPKPTDALRLVERVETRRASGAASVPRAIVSVESLARWLGRSVQQTRAWLAERGLSTERQGGGEYGRTAELASHLEQNGSDR